MKIKKVTLIGFGAMGAFFAPGMEKTLGEENFRVLADGERRQRLETRGVTINGERVHFSVISQDAEGDPADLVLIAVKEPALEQAIAAIRNQVGPGTQILCVLNGVDTEERVAAVYGWDHVLYSYMRFSNAMKDGQTSFSTEFGSIHFGEAKNETLTPRVKDVEELFDECGIRYRVDPDMIRGMWFKFMCNVGENMTCALLGVPFGAFRVSPDANTIRHAAMREVIAIANAKGIGLDEEDISRQEKTVQILPFFNKPSTLQDLENGCPTEVALFAGKAVRLGKELGVPTPVCELFYHGIRVLEEKNRGLFREEKAK